MKTGLSILSEDISSLSGKTVGICCNHTAIDENGDHIVQLMQARGVDVKRLFGPEHGVDATAQDMISVDDGEKQHYVETVSLYGETEESLHPTPESLADLDVLLFDIQDIGSRYYTYQATLGYMMAVAKNTGTEVIVLDRPNPINGIDIAGNVVRPGFESFVSAYPLATRHGMTMGELGWFFKRYVGIDCPYRVIEMQGWNREQWYDETGLPWVYPSPNMPMVETAIIYVGMCLIEGTNLSEGRGTTRPFHLFGAPWINRHNLLELLRKGANDAGLKGCIFRGCTFEPRFQKHAGLACHGAEIIVTDRNALDPLLLGMVVLEACYRENPSAFAWRTETYEYVDDPIAIDLLFGNAEGRGGIELRQPLTEILASWSSELDAFAEKRDTCLLY